MKALIAWNNQEIKDVESLDSLRITMMGMLRMDGPRALTAMVDTGAVIHVSLYEGEDYIIPAPTHAASLGSARSPRKTAAARENGAKGGRPSRELVFARLAKMSFTPAEIERIGDWWQLYTSKEHYAWFMKASEKDIREASAPAFE